MRQYMSVFFWEGGYRIVNSSLWHCKFEYFLRINREDLPRMSPSSPFIQNPHGLPPFNYIVMDYPASLHFQFYLPLREVL